MKITIIAKTKEDISDDTAYDCQAAVQECLEKEGLEVEDISFHKGKISEIITKRGR